MATLSGKFGTVTTGGSEETPVTDWNLSIASTNPGYSANSTSGWEVAVPGVKKASGTFNVVDRPSAVVLDNGILTGTTFGLVMYTLQDIFTVTIAVEDVSVAVDVTGGGIVTYTVTWSGASALTLSTGSLAGQGS